MNIKLNIKVLPIVINLKAAYSGLLSKTVFENWLRGLTQNQNESFYVIT